MAGYPLLFVFPFAMAYAASSDLLTMRIANSVSLGLVAAFLVIALIAGMPAQEMLLHLAVGVALLLAGMVLFGLNLVGGGDAKLLAAGGLWIGYDQLLPFLLCVSIFGGALALLAAGLSAAAGDACRCRRGRPACTPRGKACPTASPSPPAPSPSIP